MKFAPNRQKFVFLQPTLLLAQKTKRRQNSAPFVQCSLVRSYEEKATLKHLEVCAATLRNPHPATVSAPTIAFGAGGTADLID